MMQHIFNGKKPWEILVELPTFSCLKNIFHPQTLSWILVVGGGGLLKTINCKGRVGIEVNPNARKHAQENGVECHADLDDVSSSCIDVVISNHALEHTTSPLEILTKIHKKLKPGGKLVMVVPCEGNPVPYEAGNINQHLYTWNPLMLGNLINQAGFRVIEAMPVYHKWPPYYSHIQGLFGWRVFHATARCYGLLNFRNFQVKAVAAAD